MKKLATLCLILFIGWRSACAKSEVSEFNPANLNDGLVVSEATDLEFDINQLRQGYKKFGDLSYSHSLLILRDGKLIAEKYFHGYEASSPNALMSVTKSITSALLGIAINQGHFSDLGKPISHYFPKEFLKVEDPIKRKITLKHLLTMSAGFDANDDNPTFNQSCFNDVACIWERPLLEEPGKTFSYCSPYTDIVARMIEDASKQQLRKFAEKFLFGPMGVRVLGWSRKPMGQYRGESGLYLTSRDMLKFGWLYLNRGLYKNKRLISEEWIKDSTSPMIQASKDNGEYGYFWWMKSKAAVPYFYAWGYGGQYIYVVPAKKMVIVMTNDYYQRRPQTDIRNVIENYIIAAAR